MKRWTRYARDILPEHLVLYQKDQLKKRAFSYRHFALYMQTMELVRLGDASVQAYDTCSAGLGDLMVRLLPFNEARDGLGLEDHQLEELRNDKEQSAETRNSLQSAENAASKVIGGLLVGR